MQKKQVPLLPRTRNIYEIHYSIIGPYDNIIIPKNSKKTDWEVELAVVMVKKQVMWKKRSDGICSGLLPAQ